MGGWVHSDDEAAWKVDDSPGDCDCTTPEPDPASPCGHPAKVGTCGGPARWLVHRLDPKAVRTIDAHPHQPTTCRNCHHGIRRAEGGA